MNRSSGVPKCRCPEVSARREAGKRAVRVGSGSVRHAATYSGRHPLARFRVQVHSRSITKNILVEWRNRQRLRPTRALRGRVVDGARCRSRATLAAVRRKVRVFELARARVRGEEPPARQSLAALVWARSLLVCRTRGNDLGDRSS